jgi:hypothetical protein
MALQMKDLLHKDLNLPYNPWWFFFLFLFSNSLLTFGCFSPTLKIFIFVFGLAIPGLAAILICLPAPSRQKPSFFTDPFKNFFVPTWAWALFAAAFLFSRFGPLEASGSWLAPDEALWARYTVDWEQHWHWRVFVTMAQVSSFPSYLAWFVFKITGSTLKAALGAPALVSCATTLLGYAAARRFFSRSLCFVFLCLLAFSYWPLFMAKPLLAGSLLPLWEFLVIYILGRLLNSNRSFWAFVLGAAIGLGLYTFPAWPAMWLWLAVLGVHFQMSPSKRKFPIGGFLTGFSLAVLPFGAAAWHEGYGGHVSAVAFWNGTWFWTDQIKVGLNYIRALFWGGAPGLWVPLEGGFLNVFFASFFFLGAVELYRYRAAKVSLSLSLAFFLFLLPGLLSHDVETCRILLILPVLLIFAAIGLNALLLDLPKSRRAVFLALALMLPCGWDIFRICHWAQFAVLSGGAPAFNERQLSYEVLKPVADQQGPGLLFSEMVPFTTDNSLLVASYPFNAALNPRLDPQKAAWAAVFTDWNYVPSLRKRFPLSRWKDLTPPPGSSPGLYQLGLIPLGEGNRPLFGQWKNYYAAIQRIDFEFIDTPTGHPETRVLQDLLHFYGAVPNDPFLQSCYFEKLLYYYSFEKTFYPQDAWANWGNFREVFGKSFDKSGQDSVLCEKYGRLLASSGDPEKARLMFNKALRQDPQNPALWGDLKSVSKAPNGH